MVDVAEELGVDAIGLNHLMFSTPEEVAETVQHDRRRRCVGDRDLHHARSRAWTSRASSSRWRRSPRSAGSATSCSTTGPKVHPQLMENYYTPGAKLEGRCLYPVPARPGRLLGQGLLLPVHPRRSRRPRDVVSRGNLEWTDIRRDATTAGRARHLSGLPALLQSRAVAGAGGSTLPRRRRSAARDPLDGRSMTAADMLGRHTLLINPPLINGVAFTRQGRCQEREDVLGTTKPPYTLALMGALLRNAGCQVRLIDATAERLSIDRRHRPPRRRGLPADAHRLSQHDADARRRRLRAGEAEAAFRRADVLLRPARLDDAGRVDAARARRSTACSSASRRKRCLRSPRSIRSTGCAKCRA